MAASAERTADATTILRALTGNRWTWPVVEVVDRYPVAQGKVRLTGRPVREVISVTLATTPADEVAATPLEYEWTGGPFVRVPSLRYSTGYIQPDLWGCAPSVPTVEVSYRYGSEPPAMVWAAIDALATEMDLDDRNEACRLPERVTSVSRQGVSYTILDNQDFLDHGRTGIYEVDLVLKVFNPAGAKSRAVLFSTEMPPADRRSITVLTTGD